MQPSPAQQPPSAPSSTQPGTGDTDRAAIVEAALDCIVAMDESGVLTEFNPAAERTFGYQRDDVIGRPMAELLIPPRWRAAHHEGVARYLRTGEAHILGRRIELPALRADGTEFPVELTVIRLPAPGPVIFIGFMRDITERRRELDRTARLQSVTAALANALTPAQVAAVVVEQAAAALGADAGLIYRATPEGDALELLRSVGYPEERIGRWQRIPIELATPVAVAARRRAPLFIDSAAAWATDFPDGGPLPTLPGSTAWAAIPLTAADRVLGVMGLSFHSSSTTPIPDERDRALAVTLAQQCAQALERSRLYELAQTARAAAEFADRAKSDFLAAMSHELRTPLNAIGGYAELMALGLHGPITDAQRADLERIGRAQRYLLRLVSDVLELARLGAARVEYRSEDVPLEEIVRDVEAMLLPEVQARGIGLATGSCDPALRARADRDRVVQILLNLLSNAAKFTAAGGSITVSCGRAGDEVSISVADTGRGIPPDDLERIFDPFVQGRHDPGATRHEGAGLGLAISRELARAMGGDLEVQSTPGEGSRFTLRLPAAPA